MGSHPRLTRVRGRSAWDHSRRQVSPALGLVCLDKSLLSRQASGGCPTRYPCLICDLPNVFPIGGARAFAYDFAGK